VNRAFSNLHRQAANLSHYMNRDEEFVKECAPLLLAKYRAAFRPIGDLDIIGVEGVKISRYSSQPLLMSPAMMAEFRTFSRAY
jgi:hypothetical protein